MGTSTTKTSINWGGVVKGAAIVSAFAVVAVAGFYGIQAVAGSEIVKDILGDDTLKAFGTTLVNGLATAWEFTKDLAGDVWDWTKEMWKGLPETLGLSTSLNGAADKLVGGTTAATMTKTATIVGGVALASASAPVITGMINGTELVHHHAATAHTAAHDAAHHTAHHAAHVATERRFADKFANKTQFTSHAEAARASKPAARTIATPQESFAKDLEASTANLDRALGK